MLIKEKLAKQLLIMTLADGAISLFVYIFLRLTAEGIVISYCDTKNMDFTAADELVMMSWINHLSMVAALLFFVVLFFVMIGQKLSYIREITEGIEALRTHRMDFEIPLKDENELTELAKSINYLAETERKLKQMEEEIAAEKEALVRGLSHDIRTPLTAILSYSEYMKSRPEVMTAEGMDFVDMIQKKAEQIKVLTDRLLDTGAREVVQVDDGRLLMAQLCGEWEEALEGKFNCRINLDECPDFSGEIDIQELMRIFDNLSSNVEKYADPLKNVDLAVREEDGRLTVIQSNGKNVHAAPVESRKIGLESIRLIAAGYGGHVQINEEEDSFEIKISLLPTGTVL